MGTYKGGEEGGVNEGERILLCLELHDFSHVAI
jgi:hypothetical protein